jgi:hypothetical protein
MLRLIPAMIRDGSEEPHESCRRISAHGWRSVVCRSQQQDGIGCGSFATARERIYSAFFALSSACFAWRPATTARRYATGAANVDVSLAVFLVEPRGRNNTRSCTMGRCSTRRMNSSATNRDHYRSYSPQGSRTRTESSAGRNHIETATGTIKEDEHVGRWQTASLDTSRWSHDCSIARTKLNGERRIGTCCQWSLRMRLEDQNEAPKPGAVRLLCGWVCRGRAT